MMCPRSPPDSLASFAGVLVPPEKWIVEGICAYVPQVWGVALSMNLTLTEIYRPRGCVTHQSKACPIAFARLVTISNT